MIDISHTDPGGLQIPFSLLQGVHIIADFERDMLQSNRILVRSHSILVNRSDGKIMVIAKAKNMSSGIYQAVRQLADQEFHCKMFSTAHDCQPSTRHDQETELSSNCPLAIKRYCVMVF